MNAAQLPGTSLSGNASLTLLELFTEQAARTPRAAAVQDGARTLAYRELDEAADRTARFLRARGVGPGSLVGVCLPRGIGLVMALLGVWKAGAAYVPLDPGHPAERLRSLLLECGSDLVLAGREQADAVTAAGVRVFSPEDVLAGPESADGGGAWGPVDLDGVAYAIFTSGSTGRPKGVLVTHAGIANRVLWTVRKHALTADDRVLLKTSIGFDAAGWEIFAPLISGGTVVTAPDGTERDPAGLLGAVAAGGVTVLQVVPSVLRLLVEEPGWAHCDTLRLLFSAGEPLSAELVERLRERVGTRVAVWNTYGPTECSIDVTAHPVGSDQASGPVPIGRPLTGMRVMVMGPDGRPVPKGAMGELYAGGVGVARGYLGRPDLTAERFVPDPYGPAGSRLYRTGDLVRWNAEGALEYQGRIDGQLKVNGVRVEPEEVEAALGGHPDVNGAVVVAFESGNGGKRLGACLLARQPLDPAVLRGFLRERLPDSHIPAVFHTVDAFPLTPNGKVDRNSLATTMDETGAAAGRTGYVAPRDVAEAQVAEVWAALLGREKVGALDDFFALGGTSLQLTRLAARLRTAGGTVSMRGLFNATTVEAQARLLSAPSDDAWPIPVVSRSEPLPLSSGQRRLWFLDRLHPGSREWVAPLILRIPAATPVTALESALGTLGARHEALRTRYVDIGGEPRQVIGEAGPVELRVVDTGRDGLPAHFEEQFARGFDLARGPLWRALLVRIPGEDHVLLVTMHHIACDGWSTVILERELSELCAAAREGRTPSLPPVGIQYADYASWQNARLTEEFTAAEQAHWRAALDGISPLALPTDRPRPAERDPRGAVVPVRVEPALAAKVEELGREHGATPFMTLLTAFATVVARCSGQWDVPVGTPVAGRAHPEAAGTVGFFLNSLVVRCALAGDPTFAEALRRVRTAATAAFAHQELPFDRLVDELQPERDLSRTPLYQVAFDMHSEGVTSVATGADDLRAFAEAWSVAKTDLSVFIGRSAEGALEGVFEYATALFDAPTVVRVRDQFLRILEEVTARPDTRLSAVSMLSPAEQQRLLVEWNATRTVYPELAVHRRFEEQAARTPHAAAVVVDGCPVPYGQLEARANQIAHHLRAAGAGAESVVGVLLDRGPDLIATLLGVWKAEAAYAPLDPSYPADRIASMLGTAGATTVVTQASYEDRFTGVDVVLVDTDRTAIGARPRTAPQRVDDLDRLAYVIFTSGSTGQPKGVQVTHRGLANHVSWAAEELAAAGRRGAPLFSSVAFDLVVPNLWAPLVTGQRVYVLPQDADGADLGRLLAKAGPFSFVKLTPGHLDVLAEQLTAEQARSLAPVLVVAGEALTRATVERWRGPAPGVRLVNEYGPTEASVGTCVYPVPLEETSEVVPIGRPLPNMAMYVLDAGMRPVPVGVPGELFVGGTGVARGYAGRPDLTAERFVPDPFREVGGRLYRTGDQVRWRADGRAEFLGRLDDQVKIRGYRIEPGEIQAVLSEHPVVRDAVVVARQTPAGERQLVAYYVPVRGPAEADGAELAAHCASRLPEYMLPATYLPLAEIPLNANGKTDRGRLPSPNEPQPEARAAHVAPRTSTEERVADIWAELLNVTVGVEESFFQLGGNSILAIRLISRLQEEFGIDFKVRTVFEGPTVARISEAVEAAVRAEIDALSAAQLSTGQDLAKEFKA
ncbi:amino acid adenylation domain-containing protein [Streptomyces antimycoticus]|uniref:amino acid adenylation domain-containing protein n=1 Tax=Streptomyces antimycoticus TaxID=68175 RepID=UPI0033C34A32